MTAPEFLVSGLHAALILSDQCLSGSKFVRHVGKLGTWLDKLTGDPQMVPALEDMPADLPVVVWQSVGGEWELQVRRDRVDLHWKLTSSENDSVGTQTFYSEAADLFCSLLEDLDTDAARLAAVIERHFATPGSAAQYLAEHFCSQSVLDGPVERTENFELNSHKRFQMGDFRVNSWIKNRSAQHASGKQVAVVTCDINTLVPTPEEPRSYSAEQIRQFFAAAAHEGETIISLYYPKATCH